jgi:hypothetical protein
VEAGLAADGRDADAVAVVADAAHHAVDEVAHARRVEAAEAQRVHQRDRPRPMVKTSRRMPPTPVAAPW